MKMVNGKAGKKGNNKRKGGGLRPSLLNEHSVQAKVCFYTNIEPQGNVLLDIRGNNGTTRVGYQNVRGVGLGSGLEVATEIDVISTFGNKYSRYV